MIMFKNSLSNLVDDFLIGSDEEAQQILMKHKGILLTDQAIQKIDERIPLLQQRYGMNTRIMEKFERHRALLEDANRTSVEEALENNDRENAQADWICKQFLTLPDKGLSVFIEAYRNVLFSLRAIYYIEHLIDTNRKEFGDAW